LFVAQLTRNDHARGPIPDSATTQLHNIFPDEDLSAHHLTKSSGDLTIDGWIRLDNSAELAQALGIAPKTHNDIHLVLAAYQRWGRDCVDHLDGDFAFVIIDQRSHSAFAVRDPLGIRALYYAVTSDLFVASPTAAVFDLFEEVDSSVRVEWLADYIHNMSGSWTQTALAGVNRLPPGHWLYVTRNTVTERRYHSFDHTSPWEDTRDPRWLQAYREELLRAVSVRTEPTGLIGVETSGGIDSSTVLGVMAHTHPERIADLHTFGFALLDDEPGYILETSLAHGVSHNHILTATSRDPQPHLRAWRAIGYPAEHGNSVMHAPFYELSTSLGIRTLHSGHGGDETVTNSGELALQELIGHRQYRQTLRDLPGPVALRPARLVKRLSRRPGEKSHLTAPMLGRLAMTPLTSEVVRERDLEERTKSAARFSAPHTTVNGFVLNTRLSPMTSIRTADCSLVAASYGVEYRWALLDRRLIQQYLHTPAVWKFGEGYGRYLHRRAIAGIVPDKVAWKRSKSMGDVRVSTLRQKPVAQHIARRSVEGSAGAGLTPEAWLERVPNVLRDLLDRDRVATLLAAQSEERGHASVGRRYLNRVELLSAWLHDLGH
jgi:asparagine synthase (glutamine-hydrolysing)